MSNLLHFLGFGKRVGEAVSLPYNGDYFTAGDGTVWKSVNGNPLAYGSQYAGLLTDCPSMLSHGVLLPGPFSGFWGANIFKQIIGASGGTWLALKTTAATVAADDVYYTSTDAGQTWTERALPVALKIWTGLWDGTNFILYHTSGTTNCVQESTDGITWTPRTGISLVVISDFIYNGSVYLAGRFNSTTLATSPDRTTWTSRTCTAGGALSAGVGLGAVTWNAGAGLFIMGTSTGGQYQTSPDGATWTNRTTFPSSIWTPASVQSLFASNSTTTVIVGLGGVVATSTNGTSWTDRGYVGGSSTIFSSALAPVACYWDGTYFVVVIGGLTYYSTTGTTWTRATRMQVLPAITGSGLIKTPTGIALTNTAVLPLVMNFTNPASTTNTNIYPVPSAVLYQYCLALIVQII